MISPQKELVPFHEPLICDGPVEGWLNKVTLPPPRVPRNYPIFAPQLSVILNDFHCR